MFWYCSPMSNTCHHKGRAAVTNRTGRFETLQREAFDDGWNAVEEELPPLRTEVAVDSSRSIMTRNTSPDIPFEHSINPYRGCEHGCIYCYARPSHAWLGLSPGLDFETKLVMKPEAALLLRRHLARPSYRPKVISLGSNTDPYQPIERRYRITRQILEVLLECRHPCGIVTKSALIERDLDVLAPMAGMNLVRAYISITTLDRALARRMEPRAPTPMVRLRAIESLSRAGIPTGVMVAPVIPGLNDHEIETIIKEAAAAGATTASHVLLRLPLEIRDLFQEWLATHEPGRAKRVMALIRQCRGGKDYDSAWGRRMTGTGPVADLVSRRISMACRRYGLDRRSWSLDTTQFIHPSADSRQLSFL